MTREEALKILTERDRIRVNIINANDAETTKYNNDSVEALSMAIKALKAEPSEDWHDVPSDEMKLDEAIKDMETIAEENQRVVDTKDVTIDMLFYDDEEIEECLEQYQKEAENYRQFAEWLKELKQLRKQEPKKEQFAKWVATEIFDDMWEYNKDAFAEIACRKLAKLGIVIRMGDEWVLVDEEGESE